MSLIFLIALDELFSFINSALEHFNVREDKLEVDCLYIARGVNTAVNVDNVSVFKAAYNVNDSVALADISEEFVAQTLALRGALDESCDVYELNHSGCVFFGIIHLGELVETLVGNSYYSDVGLDRTERIVSRLRARVCNSVKECTLADIRQTYNT